MKKQPEPKNSSEFPFLSRIENSSGFFISPMASTIFEACKSRKIKPKMIFEFQNFASSGPINGVNYGTFRENIELLLQEFAEIQDYKVAGMPIWSIPLINEADGAVFPLYIIEETVQYSVNPFCDHCRFAGWGHHFVSKRKYHLIIPKKDYWERPLKGDFSEFRNHILYGLIHCNGYGHLICINGLKEVSNFLSQSHVMNFWDRICNSIKAWKISVGDDLKEGSMKLRLLHGVAFRQSWFGKWGYKLNFGSFGVTEQNYETATEYLSSLGLDKIISDFKNKARGTKIKQIWDKYIELGETSLITIGDLFQFMLRFKFETSAQIKSEEKMIESAHKHGLKTHQDSMPINFDALADSLAKRCRYPGRRIQYVLLVIVNLLKEKKANGDGKHGISRQELRDEIRKCVGDTGLIDFVLKSISCFSMGNYIIRRSINSSTKKFEFKIHKVVKDIVSTRILSSDLSSECRWPDQRVEQAATLILNILKTNRRDSPMTREELHNKAREYNGEAELIEFGLKSVSNSIVGNHIVCCSRNPSTKRVEFSIQDVANQGMAGNFGCSATLEMELEGGVHEDALFLYKNVLLGYKESDSVNLATRVILDSKQFVKEWLPEEQDMDQLMAVTCKVLPTFDELETELTRALSPGVLVVVPPSSRISELKASVQCALRDTYCIMDKFVVKQIGGLKAIEDDKVISCTIKPGELVWVRGCGMDLDTKLRYESGPSNWRVDCICGARKDDGEKMVSCDSCQVLQHTRCSGTDENEGRGKPSSFVCERCSTQSD